MNETTQNFWEVWNNLEPWQPPKIFWRLYYDDTGFPLFYTQEDLPGKYIDVTPEQFILGDMNLRVIDGQIQLARCPVVPKLTKNDTEGTPCYPNDVCIVVSDTEPHSKWKLRKYESN